MTGQTGPCAGNHAGQTDPREANKLSSETTLTPRLLIILGPTGTGKSELALTLAERLDGEVIGCDALQVYRGFNAGTAKPTPAAMKRVPHHLVDHVSPQYNHTMADFVIAAEQTIEDLEARGKLPVLAGGTGLYLRALLRGIVNVPPADRVLRARLHGMIRRYGAPRLHRWLCRLDPRSAARLLPRDSHRIVRALEFVIGNGTAWSTRLEAEGTWQSAGERFRTLKIGLDMDRGRLRERLDRRVDHFFEAGLVEEVRELLEKGVPETANAFKAIGYREIVQAIASGSSPADVVDAVKIHTWRYSKRQRTWFRREPGVVWLDVEWGLDALLERTIALWEDGSAQDHDPQMRG